MGKESNSVAEKKPFERLPSFVTPKHYVVKIKPDLKALSFEGSLEVEIDVNQDNVKELVCNAAELEVTNCRVNGECVGKVKLNEDEETMTVTLAKGLEKGSTAKLTCSFKGELNDKMRGLYRSKYTEQGEERFAAVTQFESTDCRRCFPCWDEPALKATFDVIIIRPKDRVALSNMPVISEIPDPKDPDWVEVKFDTSPKMSTYLVAIIVGEYDFIETTSEEGVKVRVYTPLGKTEQGKFALEASAKAITYYNDFFGVSYPLKKYDCIAISDFQCGAMENWGLVTFREAAVLVDPENSSASTKQWVAICVTHEMAHQWFGNLVTMEWWTHLWLNEGFASFMENTCTNDLFPEFDIWTQFVADTLIAAMELDSLKNSHPIEVDVGHPSEVDEIFDNISYNKGASVIRMLHNWIGNDAFKKGMKLYLTKYSYQNALTENLWECLAQECGKPIGKVMGTWTSQMGFPVISVSRVAGDGTSLKLTQEKFCADGSSDPSYHWNVPIKILTEKGKIHQFLLEEKSTTVTLDDLDENSWYKVNTGFYGYYRVCYEDNKDLVALKNAIEKKQLSEVDRLGVLDDLFNLVQAGKKSAVEVLELMKGFKEEESYVVWSSICNCLFKLSVILADSPCYESSFNPYKMELMSSICTKVGWEKAEDEHHTRSLLRVMILTKMGVLGHPDTVAEAKRRFQDHLNDKSSIPADLRKAVYCTVAANGDLKTFDQMKQLFRAAELQEEKDRIVRSMAAAKDPAVLHKVLEFGISDEVRAQDSPFVIISVACNLKGRDLAWEFFKTNYAFLSERYRSGMLMSRISKHTTENFTTFDKAREIKQFFTDNPNPAERTIKQSIESVNLNASWLQRDGDKLKNYFS